MEHEQRQPEPCRDRGVCLVIVLPSCGSLSDVYVGVGQLVSPAIGKAGKAGGRTRGRGPPIRCQSSSRGGDFDFADVKCQPSILNLEHIIDGADGVRRRSDTGGRVPSGGNAELFGKG